MVRKGLGRTGLCCPRLFLRPSVLGGRRRGSRRVRGLLGGLQGGRRFGIFAAAAAFLVVVAVDIFVAVAVAVAAVEVAVASVVAVVAVVG